MKKICVVITARPSYSRIRSALFALKKKKDIKLQINFGYQEQLFAIRTEITAIDIAKREELLFFTAVSKIIRPDCYIITFRF